MLIRNPGSKSILTLYLVAFHAYPSPAYDGSILLWNGTDDLIQITHINQEDDESIEPKETQIRINERIFGRNVHQNISSISLTDQGKVGCVFLIIINRFSHVPLSTLLCSLVFSSKW